MLCFSICFLGFSCGRLLFGPFLLYSALYLSIYTARLIPRSLPVLGRSCSLYIDRPYTNTSRWLPVSLQYTVMYYYSLLKYQLLYLSRVTLFFILFGLPHSPQIHFAIPTPSSVHNPKFIVACDIVVVYRERVHD